ncbi:transposase [Streptomyces sp. NPDC019208]|uniref:transposase n=1 Tax=Streptomyces sp. NPDC019208 TaxID=3154683 RepID=UPI0033D6B981
MPLIEGIHAGSGATYGARRITRALRRKGVVAHGAASAPRSARRAVRLPPGGGPAQSFADHQAGERPIDQTSPTWRSSGSCGSGSPDPYGSGSATTTIRAPERTPGTGACP